MYKLLKHVKLLSDLKIYIACSTKKKNKNSTYEFPKDLGQLKQKFINDLLYLTSPAVLLQVTLLTSIGLSQ